MVFERLPQVLVFGCAYRRIVDGSCPGSMLRRRRNEWIDLGMIEALREMVPTAHDRTIGLEPTDVAVDRCIDRLLAAARRRAGAGGYGEQGIALPYGDANSIPIGDVADPASRNDSPFLIPTLELPLGVPAFSQTVTC